MRSGGTPLSRNPEGALAAAVCGRREPLHCRLLRSPVVHLTVGIALIALVLGRWVEGLGGPEAFRERFGMTAVAASTGLHALLALSPIPADMLALANGTLYGVALGALVNWLGWMLASVVEFQIARHAARDFDLATHLERLPGWLGRFPVAHPLFLIGARQITHVGGHLVNISAGAGRVSRWRHTWCSAVGCVPGSLVTAAVGAGVLKAL